MIMLDMIISCPKDERGGFGNHRLLLHDRAMTRVCFEQVKPRLETGLKCPVSSNKLFMYLHRERRTELPGFLYGVNLEVVNRETLT